MINFGGVIDEEISDEFLMGTCTNDIYRYEFATNCWSRAEVAVASPADLELAAFCARFNSMMAISGQQLLM